MKGELKTKITEEAPSDRIQDQEGEGEGEDEYEEGEYEEGDDEESEEAELGDGGVVNNSNDVIEFDDDVLGNLATLGEPKYKGNNQL